MLVLVALSASPAWASPEAVVRGDDVVAWREISLVLPQGDDGIRARRAFVEDFPTSPFAEVAWGWLAERDALDPAWATLPALQAVGARWAASQAALANAPVEVAPGRLTPDGQPVELIVTRNSIGGPRSGKWKDKRR